MPTLLLSSISREFKHVAPVMMRQRRRLDMGWFGKFACGFVGFQMWGIRGLLIGIIIGHFVDADDPLHQIPHSTKSRRYRQSFDTFFSSVTDRHQVFFVSVFSMLARVARADGAITAGEIESVIRFMEVDLNLDPQRKEFAKNIFRAARVSDRPFADYASDFYKVFRHQPAMLENLVDILFRLSIADGAIHPAEERLLDEAARIFKLSEETFSRIRSRYRASPDKHYAILGCTKDMPFDQIKKRYRALVLEHHPDRIVRKGQPEEFVKLATEKFREIQEAYEAVKAEKGMS